MIEVKTPFGVTSSPILIKEIGAKRVAFLARHGKGHVMSPSFVPYRANIWAAKALGVERILSINGMRVFGSGICAGVYVDGAESID